LRTRISIGQLRCSRPACRITGDYRAAAVKSNLRTARFDEIPIREPLAGRPPKEYQFKPGQSGNPKGAKGKPKSMAPDLKAALEQALNKTVKVKQGDQERIVTMATAGIEQLVAQLAKGHRHARHDVRRLFRVCCAAAAWGGVLHSRCGPWPVSV
jgi:hypothetical protein